MPFVDVGGLRGHHHAFPFRRLETQLPTSWTMTTENNLDALAGDKSNSDWYNAIKALETLGGPEEYNFTLTCIGYLQTLNTTDIDEFIQAWEHIGKALNTPYDGVSSLSQCIVFLLLQLIGRDNRTFDNYFKKEYAKTHTSKKTNKKGNSQELDREWNDMFLLWIDFLEGAFHVAGILKPDEHRSYLPRDRDTDPDKKTDKLKTYNKYIFSKHNSNSDYRNLFKDIGMYIYVKYLESRPDSEEEDVDSTPGDNVDNLTKEESKGKTGDKPGVLTKMATYAWDALWRDNSPSIDPKKTPKKGGDPAHENPGDASLFDEIDHLIPDYPSQQPGTQELNGIKSQLASLKTALNVMIRNNGDFGSLQHAKELTKEISNLYREILGLQGTNSKREADITSQQNTINGLNDILRNLESQKDDLYEKYEKLVENVNSRNDADDEVKKSLGKTEEKLKAASREKTALETSNAKLETQLSDLPGVKNELDRAKATNQLLRDQLSTLNDKISETLESKLDAIAAKADSSYSVPPKVYDIVGRPHIETDALNLYMTMIDASHATPGNRNDVKAYVKAISELVSLPSPATHALCRTELSKMGRQLDRLSSEEARGAVPLGMLRIALGSLEKQMANLKKCADSRSLVKLREFLKFYLDQVITNVRTKVTVNEEKALFSQLQANLSDSLKNKDGVQWEKDLDSLMAKSVSANTLLSNPEFRELFFTECWSVTFPVMNAIATCPNAMPYTFTNYEDIVIENDNNASSWSRLKKHLYNGILYVWKGTKFVVSKAKSAIDYHGDKIIERVKSTLSDQKNWDNAKNYIVGKTLYVYHRNKWAAEAVARNAITIKERIKKEINDKKNWKTADEIIHGGKIWAYDFQEKAWKIMEDTLNVLEYTL